MPTYSLYSITDEGREAYHQYAYFLSKVFSLTIIDIEDKYLDRQERIEKEESLEDLVSKFILNNFEDYSINQEKIRDLIGDIIDIMQK